MTVSDITAETCVLSWQPPADDGGRPVKSYTIEKKEATRSTWSEVAVVNDTTPYKIEGLTEGKSYVLRINAKNEVGSSKFVESKSFIAKHPFGKYIRHPYVLSFTKY